MLKAKKLQVAYEEALKSVDELLGINKSKEEQEAYLQHAAKEYEALKQEVVALESKLRGVAGYCGTGGNCTSPGSPAQTITGSGTTRRAPDCAGPMISATILPLAITPGRPAPGCVPAPAKYRLVMS